MMQTRAQVIPQEPKVSFYVCIYMHVETWKGQENGDDYRDKILAYFDKLPTKRMN